MKTVKELREERRELNRQLRENAMNERRQAAKEAREQERAEMSVEDKSAEAVLDAAYAKIPAEVIIDLQKRRPVVADMIQERIARHAAASAAKSTE